MKLTPAKPRRAMLTRGRLVAAALAAALLAVAAWTHSHFRRDIERAAARAASGSRVLATRCGPIEVQESGRGAPLLVVHGSGGGHDQGLAFVPGLADAGIRVIAVSRFGYLRTPRPADASPAAQADAHICVLDALGLARAAVLGGSAGGPSAIEAAIRHPERVSALVLLVAIAYKPGTVVDSAPPPSDTFDALLLRLLGSDFLFWSALHVARDPVIRWVLATPPDQVARASGPERARIDELIERILPVSQRAQGLADDTRLGKSLAPFALDRVRAPTLVVSARDDGFGTYATAQYTAAQIPGARFLGFDQGGHLLVGHSERLRGEIAEWVKRSAMP
jgi:pimeloyl-ACP methyl ester carboxylesterase